MSNLSFRKLDRERGETTPTGPTTETETVYEYGLEVDGVFVRIGTVTEGQVADARVRQDAEQERNPQPAQPAEQQSGGTSESGGTAPDEQSTVSQTRSSGAKR